MFTDSDFVSALEDRELVSTDQYDATVNKRSLDLAQADMLIIMANIPAISEGQFSVSKSDKDMAEKTSRFIYSKYGETGPFTSVIQDASELW